MKFFITCALLFFSAVVFGQTEVDDLRQKLSTATSDTAKVRLLLDLGFYYEAESPDSALAIYERAEKLASQAHFTIGRAKAWQYSGIVCTSIGRNAEAIVRYQRALSFYEEANDVKGLASTTNNIGNAYLFLSNYQKAINAYLKALPYFQEKKDHYSLVVIYGNMGECYRQLKEFSPMLEAARSSYAAALTMADSTEIANASISLGVALSQNNQPDSALLLLRQAQTIGKNAQDVGVQFMAVYNLADQLIRNRNTSAIELAEEAMALAVEWNYAYATTNAYLLRGRAKSLDKKKWKDALADLQTALSLSREQQSQEQELNVLDALSLIYEEKGDAKQALIYRNEYVALNQRIFDDKSQKQIAELRTLFELADKDRQIHIEKAANVDKDKIIVRRGWLIAAAVASLIVLLVLAFILIRSISTKRRLAEKDAAIEREKAMVLELEQEALRSQWDAEKLRSLIEGQDAERNRLGRELHDGLGGMLTAARLQMEQLIKVPGVQIPPDKYLSLQNLITKTGVELRKVSHDLAPEGIDQLGLAKATEQFCARVSGEAVSVHFHLFGEPTSFGLNDDVIIFRMVQELVNNAMKHADCRKIDVSLNFMANQEFSLVVEDDGKGFDPQAASGKGLSNIRSRATYLKGDLDVHSVINKGTSITLLITS